MKNASSVESIAILKERYARAELVSYGDSHELSERLIALIRRGTKTASCGAVRDYLAGEARPELGRCDIVLDWNGVPALVLQTLDISECRFSDVTEIMALAEGEDDDLAGWRAGHRSFFERNGGFSWDMELLFERFVLVEDLRRR